MNNDLISREALKKALELIDFNDSYDLTRTEQLIDNAQTVEPKQGEWGKHGECPFCSYIKQWEDDKFCGNCGAKLGKGGAE